MTHARVHDKTVAEDYYRAMQRVESTHPLDARTDGDPMSPRHILSTVDAPIADERIIDL